MEEPAKRPQKPLFGTAALSSLAVAACVFLAAAASAATKPPSPPSPPPPPSAVKVISHNLTITISPFARTLRGTDTIKILPQGGRLRLVLNRKARLQRLRLNGKRPHYSVKNLKEPSFKEIIIDVAQKKGRKKPLTLSISFNETFGSIASAEKKIKRGISYVNVGVMGRRGVFLPSYSYWYPHVEDGTAQYNISINMPKGYTTVAEGDWLLHMSSADRTFDRWKTTRPVDGLDLVSSRFRVKKTIHNGVKIYTFFLKRDSKLSALYTKKTGGYLDLYSKLFGEYPFKKFAVVESFLPTGYGMPSFTLLGSKVLRLPFIPDTSLGHEIAHSWWGNSVFIDAAYGNWSEALTTYTADYLYEREKGEKEARTFRFRKLEGYRNFAGKDAPSLRDFKYATEPAERAVGYNKGVMVFSMLEDLLGSGTFEKGLREFYKKNAFRRATWLDIEAALEDASGKDLKGFFSEWLERPGGPELELRGVSERESGEGYETAFTITQKAPPYKLSLLARITTTDGKVIEKKIEIKKEKNRVSIETTGRPSLLEVDPDYRVFRILSAGEVPPSLSVALGDKDALIITTGTARGRDGRIAGAKLLAKDYGLKIGNIKKENTEKTLSMRSVFIIGGPGMPDLLEGLDPVIPEDIALGEKTFSIGDKTYSAEKSALAIALKNPFNAEKVIVIFSSGSASRTVILKEIKKIRYFTKYGYVLIENGKVVKKGAVPSKNALSYRFEAAKTAGK